MLLAIQSVCMQKTRADAVSKCKHLPHSKQTCRWGAQSSAIVCAVMHMHAYSVGHLPQQILCGLVLLFYFSPKVNCNSSILNIFVIVLKNNAESSAGQPDVETAPSLPCFILWKSFFFFSWEGTWHKLKPQNNLRARTKGNECNITHKNHFVHIAVGLKISFHSDVISKDIMQQTCYSNCHNSLCSLNLRSFQDICSLAQTLTSVLQQSPLD